MSVSVLVPSFRDAVLVKLFRSMESSEPRSTMRVTVLDNGIGDEMHECWPQVRFIPMPVGPYVTGAAFNVGFSFTAHDDIVILSDDVEIATSGWYAACDRLFREWPPEYGVLTFATGRETTRRTRALLDTNGELVYVTLGPGLVIPRRVLDAIGPWDETLVGYGMDDFDYGIRCLHAGYRLGVTNAVVLRNDAQATGWVDKLGSYEAVLAQQDVNFEIFHRKWHGDAPLPPKPWAITFPVCAEHLNRASCACRKDA